MSESKQVVITIGCNSDPTHARLRGTGSSVAEALAVIQAALVSAKWAGSVRIDRTYVFCPACAQELNGPSPGRDGT